EESVVPQPRSPTQTPVADEAASIGVDVRYRGATTTATRLETGQGSDDLEDPSKHGRKIAAIDQDPGISLVQHDVEIQGRYGHDMEFDFDFDAAKEVSTGGTSVTTASVVEITTSLTRNTRVSTTDDITMAGKLVYIRKREVKDKGKGKMDESEK
ncbi:hypothetical protein Tco_0125115, partial [Tanacetum coccineum]